MASPPLRIPVFPRHISNPPIPTTSSRTPSTPSRISVAYSWISNASTKVPNSPSGASVTRSSRASTISSSYSSTIHHLEIVSLAPATPTSPYFSLVLRVQNHPARTQDAIFLYSEANARCYSFVSPAGPTTPISPIQPTIGNQISIPRQRDMVNKVLSKVPQYIFHDTNFGNPWYILEIQQTDYGEPCFGLVARYAYQLLISNLKEPSQLYLRRPDGQERDNLYERFNLTYVDKLGNLAYTGYLGEDDVEDIPRLVFIKTLDLRTGPEKDGEPAVDRIEQVNSIYEEINLLNIMPMHPYLTPAPMGYITLGSEEGVERQGRKIVGYVNRYYVNGRLSDYLFLPGELDHPPAPRPITILQKAKWALQITSAMMHIHRKAGVSLGDGGRGFGLERFMVDEFMQLHLSGFGASERVARNSWRVPPEARIRGEWDVEEVINNRDSHSLRKLVWTHSDYVRLRWEQDNAGAMDDGIDPFLTPPPSPTKSANIKTDDRADSISENSISSKSTIGKSGRDGCSSIRKSDTKSYESCHDDSSSITKVVDRFKEGGVGAVYGMGRGESVRRCNEGSEGFDQKKRAAIFDNSWSAFEEWRHIPRALEIVETYSLGVMLWLLFEQVQLDNFSSGSEEPVIAWSINNKIPGQWRRLVEACVKKNPADRIEMEEVLKYFVGEVGRRWNGGWLMG